MQDIYRYICYLFRQQEHSVTCSMLFFLRKGKSEAVPLQAWSGPEDSKKLRFPDFTTTAQDGRKVVSLTHRPPLPPGNAPGTHFFWRLNRPQTVVRSEGFYVNEKFQ